MKESVKIYGFGSFFNDHAKSHDIDLLVIHRSTELESCLFAIRCKEIIQLNLENTDISILSLKEEEQFSTIVSSNAIFLGIVNEESLKIDFNRVLKMLGLLSTQE